MKQLIKFECYWMSRQPLVWFGCIIMAMMAFLSSVTNIDFGAGNQVNLDSSYSINITLLILGAVFYLFAAVFITNSALKDISTGMEQVVFAAKVAPQQLYLARLFCCIFVCWIGLTCLLLGLAIAGLTPMAPVSRVEGFSLVPFMHAWLSIALPNAIVMGSLLFSVAVLTRKMGWVYLVVIIITASFAVHQMLYSIDTRQFIVFSDPLGIFAYVDDTRFWTLEEKNNNFYGFEQLFAANRVVWILISSLLVFAAYLKVGLQRELKALSSKKETKPQETQQQLTFTGSERPKLNKADDKTTTLLPLKRMLLAELSHTLLSKPFFAIMLIFVLNLAMGSLNYMSNYDGAQAYPTTMFMLERIKESYLLAIYVIIILYSAQLVHRESDLNVNDLINSLPVSALGRLSVKLVALYLLVFSSLLIAMLTALSIQLAVDANLVALGDLFAALFVNEGIQLYITAFLAITVQSVVRNKYFGISLLVLYLLSLKFMEQLGFEDHLYRFEVPTFTYTSLNELNGFVWIQLAYGLYWAAIIGCIFYLSSISWTGARISLSERLSYTRAVWNKRSQGVTLVLLLSAVVIGGLLVKSTRIDQTYLDTDVLERRAATAEKQFTKYTYHDSLSATDVELKVDMYPEQGMFTVSGEYTLANNNSLPISELLIRVSPAIDINNLTLADAQLIETAPHLGYHLFKFNRPIESTETVTLKFDLTLNNNSFGRRLVSSNIVANGSFIRPFDVLPSMGYFQGERIKDEQTRKRYQLSTFEPKLKQDDVRGLKQTFLGNLNHVNFHAIVSTTRDQVAVTSGELVKQWSTRSRAFFEYQSNEPIALAVPFLSARYHKKSMALDNVTLNVFYHPSDNYNVELMLNAMKDAVEDFTERFGPLSISQLSIVETPGFQSNAMSLSNIIPFSANHGFTMNVKNTDGLNRLYFTVAHEVAHQWWAHQLTAANVKGAMMLSETIAQDAALQLVKKKYGNKTYLRFLRYELDRYLALRANAVNKEVPLQDVEGERFIAYHKGALVFNSLRQLLGDSEVDAVLKEFYNNYKLSGIPYPTSKQLVESFLNYVDAKQKTLIKGLFSEPMEVDISLSDIELSDIEVIDTEVIDTETTALKSTSYVASFSIHVNQVAPQLENQVVDVLLTDSQGKVIYQLRHPLSEQSMDYEVQLKNSPARIAIDPEMLFHDIRPFDNIAEF